MRAVQLILVLVVVIYAALIIIPGRDHEGITVTRDDGERTGNFFTNLLSAAEEEATTPPRDPAVIVARADRLVAQGKLEQRDDGTYLLQTADGEWIEIAAIIDPTDLLPNRETEPGEIASVDVTSPDAVAPDVAEEAPGTEVAADPVADARVIWRVTGDRVNFRAGPTTDSAILAALVRGDEVEFLADAPDGWAHLRVVATNLEGYMAARFLEPVN